MRTSVASLAVISRFERGQFFYLAHWNTGWNAFSLPGGHKRDGETHRACLVRELAEPDELHLPPPPKDVDADAAAPVENVNRELVHVRVDAEPLGRLEYEAFSQSKNERTNYVIELFAAELSPGACTHINGNLQLRWLSEQEIEAGHTLGDNKTVSDTLRHHLGWLSRQTPVTWELAALKRTREVMAEELAGTPDETRLVRECVFVARQLRLMFPEARAIAVRQRFEGFRPRLRPHKLLVEVTGPSGVLAPGVFGCREVHVVKVGRPLEPDRADDLEEELRGWQRCKPAGTDTILSTLRGVPESEPYLGLIYSDAVTALGGLTGNLEDAVRACCRFGVPSLSSILLCLRQLYDRLNLRLYGQSFDPAPALHLEEIAPPGHPIRRHVETAVGSPTRLRARLQRGLEMLCEKPEPAEGEERRRLRREALAILTVREDLAFLDPFDYLKGALAGTHPVPFMLVGSSHGDLHGRNIQVGLMLEEVGAPAVFDYGDMHPANHIGWDFVKLETELKVRMYRHLFPRERRQFLKQVQAFEVRLAARTVALHHNSPSLAPPAEINRSQERLMRVLLEVRQQARRCLGVERHGRLHRWLEEYFFLLACYGCNASAFPTYDDQEWLAVYCSAGTAARQLSLPWRNLAPDIEEARKLARKLLNAPPAPDCAGLVTAAGKLELFAHPRLNHHARQEFARVWVEADVLSVPHFVEAGLQLLEKLQGEFPHALEIDELMALALLELGRAEEAWGLVREVRQRHFEQAYEIECRLGRMIRGWAESLWPADQPAMPQAARTEFQRALEVYRRAWENSRHYYPGINVAALMLLLAEDESGRIEAREVAGTVLALAGEQPTEDVWALLTQADAHVLRGEDARAEQLYRHARPRCSAQMVRSVVRQLRLLQRVPNESGKVFWNDQQLKEVFGVEAAAAPTITTPLGHGQRPEIS